MHITELPISAATLACLGAASISHVDQLVQYPADEVLEFPHLGAMELYELVCQLNDRGLSLPSSRGGRVRAELTARNREIVRLRLIDGWTFAQIAERVNLTTERTRQILRQGYGVKAQPPSVKARRWRERVHELSR